MAEDTLDRLLKALDKFENLVLRLENIERLKTSDKKVFKFDMGVVNKAFDEGMKKALKQM